MDVLNEADIKLNKNPKLMWMAAFFNRGSAVITVFTLELALAKRNVEAKEQGVAN